MLLLKIYGRFWGLLALLLTPVRLKTCQDLTWQSKFSKYYWVRNRFRYCIWPWLPGRRNRRGEGKAWSVWVLSINMPDHGVKRVWEDGRSPKARFWSLWSPWNGLQSEAINPCLIFTWKFPHSLMNRSREFGMAREFIPQKRESVVWEALPVGDAGGAAY